MNAREWFTEEEFWRVSFPFMFPPERVEVAQAEADEIIALTDAGPGDLLDMCCGPGRHSLAFAKRGFRVTGVDATAFLLDRARERGEAEDVTVEWVESDMRKFVRPESFDLSINLFTSFGFFEDPGDNLAVLENVRRSLRPGGSFVLDVLGKEVLARKFQAMDAQESADGELVVQRRRVVDDWTRIETDWMFISDERTRHFGIQLWIYSGQELRQLLFEAGFDAVELYGDLAGGPYDTAADRLIAVAVRAG